MLPVLLVVIVIGGDLGGGEEELVLVVGLQIDQVAVVVSGPGAFSFRFDQISNIYWLLKHLST